MTATPQMPESLPSLDGLRAIAALLVVFVHFTFYVAPESPFHYLQLFPGARFPFGPVGVAGFFTLSGFLMAYLYAWRPCTAPALLGYLVARFARIVPAYWLTLLLCFCLYLWLDGAFVFRIDGQNLLRHLLFLGSEGVFWSIPPEIQYYLLFAVLWGGWQQWLAGQWRGPLLLALLCVGLMLSRDYWPGILLPAKLHFFLAGSAAALLLRALQRRLHPSLRTLMGLQLGMLLVLACALAGLVGVAQQTFYLHHPFFLLVALLLLLFAWRTPFSDALLGNRPLRWLGRVSFSVYLLHVPVIFALVQLQGALGLKGSGSDLLILLLAVLLPGLACEYIELPLCRACRQWAHRRGEALLLRRQRA